jgi:hypothetical protein
MYINFYIKLVERAFWRMIDVEEKHWQRFPLPSPGEGSDGG